MQLQSKIFFLNEGNKSIVEKKCVEVHSLQQQAFREGVLVYKSFSLPLCVAIDEIDLDPHRPNRLHLLRGLLSGSFEFAVDY